jgi:hypothetical protein
LSRSRAVGWTLLCSLALPLPLFAQATPPNLTGKWTGTLINLPLRSGAPKIDVTIEIGPMLAADHTCAPWKTTYSEGGVVKQVKDYQFCRGTGPDDLYTDEGGGVKLAARWVGDVLVSPFKVDNLLLIVETRLRGDVLEEEIFTIDDQPAIKGILPLKARSIQRLTLRRAATSS